MVASEPAAAGREAALAEALAALGSPVRLALLRQLRAPRILRDIAVVTDEPSSGVAVGPRVVSRQAVREHLDRLLELGVVVARNVQGDRGPTQEYVVNHQRLFALSEEVKVLAKLRPLPEVDAPTLDDAGASQKRAPAGPRLVLVRGLDEGRAFPLAPPPSGKREWVLGRRRDAEVPLDFDPFVSTSHAAVVWDGAGFAAVDLPDSRNGTLLNFERLAKGVPTPLRHGDLLGLGRTALVFHRDR